MTGTYREMEDEYVASARVALRSVPGDEALRTLGWSDLLPLMDDPEARRAVFALFRAQGHELVTSGAIGALMAHAYSPSGWGSVPVTATIARDSPRRGTRTVVLGVPSEGQLLVDRPGEGARLVDVAQADWRPVELPGCLDLHELQMDLSRVPVSIPEARASVLRGHSLALGRTAFALDILGSSEAALELAVEHANHREQFGQPIGRFQAVRHLLAWARADCAGIAAVSHQMVELDTRAPEHYDKVVKSVAGRNGRRACQHSLQVLGAIGFTAEHRHHQYYSRVLGLDSLLGNSTVLTHDLAVNWRQKELDLPLLTMALLSQAE